MNDIKSNDLILNRKIWVNWFKDIEYKDKSKTPLAYYYLFIVWLVLEGFQYLYGRLSGIIGVDYFWLAYDVLLIVTGLLMFKMKRIWFYLILLILCPQILNVIKEILTGTSIAWNLLMVNAFMFYVLNIYYFYKRRKIN